MKEVKTLRDLCFHLNVDHNEEDFVQEFLWMKEVMKPKEFKRPIRNFQKVFDELLDESIKEVDEDIHNSRKTLYHAYKDGVACTFDTREEALRFSTIIEVHEINTVKHSRYGLIGMTLTNKLTDQFKEVFKYNNDLVDTIWVYASLFSLQGSLVEKCKTFIHMFELIEKLHNDDLFTIREQ